MFVDFIVIIIIIILWCSYFLSPNSKKKKNSFSDGINSKSILLVTIFKKIVWEILGWSGTRRLANLKQSCYFSLIGSIIDPWSPLMQSILEGPWCISMGHLRHVKSLLSIWYNLHLEVTPFIWLFPIIAKLEILFSTPIQTHVFSF